jgi:hypothetical protein
LTGWWTGDGSGADVVGGRTASLHGDATFGTGIVDQAFDLDGDGDFVSVPNDSALNVGTGDFTVDLWVWFRTTAGEQVIVEKWVQRFEPDLSSGWTFTKLDDNSVLLALSPEGAEGDAEVGAQSRPLNLRTMTWYHFAARRHGTEFTILMNGRVIARDTLNIVGSLDSESSLKFGHRGAPSDTPGSQDESGFFLNGRVDEVELFVGTAVPNGYIKALAIARSSGKCKPA